MMILGGKSSWLNPSLPMKHIGLTIAGFPVSQRVDIGESTLGSRAR
jgi:hypothetical protein